MQIPMFVINIIQGKYITRDIAATMEHGDPEPAAEDFGSEEELSEGEGSEKEEEIIDEETNEDEEKFSDEDMVEEEESLPCLQEDPKIDCPVCGLVLDHVYV